MDDSWMNKWAKLGLQLRINDTLKTPLLTVIWASQQSTYWHLDGTMVASLLDLEGRKEILYLTMYSTYFLYRYMTSDIWKRTTQIASWLISSYRLTIGINCEEKKNTAWGEPTATTWANLFDYQQGVFYIHHPTDRIPHTFAKPVMDFFFSSIGAPWWINPMTHRNMSWCSTMQLHLARR